ncbi:hypothetical protein NDU88_007295 [Pleurodeles waltl]|uniref:Uncharacterized protein n=1 Tax=Pleurodeles waltl TaxID=8319 RepID=A0AAV7SSE8_PLEWA|nr:hypothetical protein NDU88_007295 [Pleurodeles waltl]
MNEPRNCLAQNKAQQCTMKPLVNQTYRTEHGLFWYLRVREENFILQKRALMNGEETSWKSGAEYYHSCDKRKNEEIFQHRCLAEESGNRNRKSADLQEDAGKNSEHRFVGRTGFILATTPKMAVV